MIKYKKIITVLFIILCCFMINLNTYVKAEEENKICEFESENEEDITVISKVKEEVEKYEKTFNNLLKKDYLSPEIVLDLSYKNLKKFNNNLENICIEYTDCKTTTTAEQAGEPYTKCHNYIDMIYTQYKFITDKTLQMDSKYKKLYIYESKLLDLNNKFSDLIYTLTHFKNELHKLIFKTVSFIKKTT